MLGGGHVLGSHRNRRILGHETDRLPSAGLTLTLTLTLTLALTLILTLNT